MGLTPLDGLVMGTRSGSIDPSIIKFMMDETDKSIDEITDEHDYYDEIQNYYYLEYNNLIHSDNYNVSWFELRN